MLDWACPRCATANDADFGSCARCGTRTDGTADPALADAAGIRVVDCLRCDAPMTRRSARPLPEDHPPAPVLVGDVGELPVDRETFEVYACSACGKVELFLPARTVDA